MLQTQVILNSKLLAMAGLIHFWQKKFFAVMRKIRFLHAIDYHHSFTSLDHNFCHRQQKHHWLRKLNPGEVTSRLFENVDKICRNKYIIIILDGTRNYTGYMEDILVFLIFDKPLWNGKCFVGPNVAGVYYSQKRLHFLAAILVCLITKCNKNL